jgi:hypothetical protein
MNVAARYSLGAADNTIKDELSIVDIGIPCKVLTLLYIKLEKFSRSESIGTPFYANSE